MLCWNAAGKTKAPPGRQAPERACQAHEGARLGVYEGDGETAARLNRAANEKEVTHGDTSRRRQNCLHLLGCGAECPGGVSYAKKDESLTVRKQFQPVLLFNNTFPSTYLGCEKGKEKR